MQFRRATLLIIGTNDVPRRFFGIGRLEHYVARSRVVVPTSAGGQVGRAKLPLAHRVFDAGFETPLLLLIAHFEPELDQLDSTFYDVAFEHWTEFEKAVVLFFSAKAHDELDTSPVVPTTIEDHDLTRSGEMLQVALHVHLRLLAVRWRWKGYYAEDARTHTFGDRLDGAALASTVTALKYKNDSQTFVLYPILELAKLHLQLPQFLRVFLVAHLGLGLGAGSLRFLHNLFLWAILQRRLVIACGTARR